MMTNYPAYETYLAYAPILLVIVMSGAQCRPTILDAEVDSPQPLPAVTLDLNAIIFGAIASKCMMMENP